MLVDLAFLNMLNKLLCTALLAVSLNAHGGIYRGPGDVVPPPAPGGRTGGPSGPAGPTTGRPGSPTAGPPSIPGGRTGGPGRRGGGYPGGPRTGPRGGIRIGDDLTSWLYWWEFNKDPFIRLRDKIHEEAPQTGSLGFYLGPTGRLKSINLVRPTDADRLEILMILKKAIDSTNNRDIVTSCMIAMAKIGKDHPTFKLIDVFRPRLYSNNQEIRETAILAMGIAGMEEEATLELLMQVARGSKPDK